MTPTTDLAEDAARLGVDHAADAALGLAAARVEIAVRRRDAPGRPGLVWLGGFRSDMTGTKAEAMVTTAARLGLPSLRFDYSGHGESGGAFEEGTISRWTAEALAVLRARTDGPQILVGSSMGGWVALRLVQELQRAGEAERIAGLLLIAPAPDFTDELMEPAFTDAQRAAMARDGRILEPTPYSDEPNVITAALVEDGRRNRVLDRPPHVGRPVRILQGMADPDVPHTHALRLVEALVLDDVAITLVRDGDHRLSREADIALLERTIETLVGDIAQARARPGAPAGSRAATTAS